MKVLITGSSGYYGSILYAYLTSRGIDCDGLDIYDSSQIPDNCKIICDLCDEVALQKSLYGKKYDAIIHLASNIDFAVKSQNDLYKNNIYSTRNLIDVAKILDIKKIIYTSSNSIYLGNKNSLIKNEDFPSPIDSYGRSKVDSERMLLAESKNYDVNILRCPNIIDAGRVGMLSILFELLSEGATLWVIKNGNIKHQCLYAQDLNAAIYKLLFYQGTTIHNIGSDNVPTFREAFERLIKRSRSVSKVRSLPGIIIVPLLKVLYNLKLSPLGPYQFRMLTQNFEFDLSAIKRDLDWVPTKNNTEILEVAYQYYLENIDNIKLNSSANSSPVNMKILSILKYIKW